MHDCNHFSFVQNKRELIVHRSRFSIYACSQVKKRTKIRRLFGAIEPGCVQYVVETIPHGGSMIMATNLTSLYLCMVTRYSP